MFVSLCVYKYECKYVCITKHNAYICINCNYVCGLVCVCSVSMFISYTYIHMYCVCCCFYNIVLNKYEYFVY